ncbi:ArnT family glycosyltransferase [Edaphobacter bradus]|uniref:ArnT family glycosyltransferase n=1 Tax=Edaphobacter bradus TaxID=2259016 RepID=UPI0021E09D7E|nr:glycosyltransferase family 39 protein [Edaphobacter bradus]
MRLWSRRGFVVGGVALLLLVFALQFVTVVKQESLTWDEGDHIFAGYMSWKTHDYGLNPEHPPLMKMLATVPLLGLPLHVPADQHRFFKDEAYLDGRDMLFGSGPAYSAETLTFRARMATGIVAMLLGLLVFLAAQEMFGAGAGFLALTLLVFEPNVLAHCALVTTDVGVSCFFLATVYAFYRYCKSPSVGRMVVAGLAAGLALATKHSAVLLLPMVGLLAAAEVAFRFPESGVAVDETRARRAVRLCRALAAMAGIAVVVLWGFYGFRYDARPGALRLDPSLAEYVHPLKAVEAKGILFLSKLHILPESYLYGLADVRAMANGMPSFIFGRVYDHGVWFYFPAVLVIKSTLGFLALALLAFAALAAGKLRRWREILFVLVPAGVYLWVAMGSSLNIGARHILPVYAFLCVFAAGGCWAWIERGSGAETHGWSRGWAAVVGVLLMAHVVSTARAYPNYMAYSNELWGGPSQTHKVLTDSNTDWAQQLLAVKKYTDEKGIKECWFAYFADPFLRPRDYGIPCRPLPTPDAIWSKMQYPVPPVIQGPVFLSAGDLTWFEAGSNVMNPYREFQGLKPSAMIQDGVLVFEGGFHVPLASAMSHVLRSAELLKQQKKDEALAEAQQAVAIAPDALQTQMALGDALAAARRGPEAHAAYARALRVAQTMEPGARETWSEAIRKKM